METSRDRETSSNSGIVGRALVGDAIFTAPGRERSKEVPSGQHGGEGVRGPHPMASEHTCSVCLELFTEPKILPCCHTFCLECLEKSKITCSGRSGIKTTGQVTCPKCRKPHEIPAGGLAALLTDFIAEHEVEAKSLNKTSKNTKVQLCGECGKSGPVSHFCSNCQKYLCRVCGIELHKRLKIYEGHKVCPIAEVNAATLQSCKVHHCALHGGEVLKLYCEDCQQVICRDCTLVKHRKHNFKFVEEARENVKKVMKSLKSNVEEKFTALKHNLQDIKTVEAAAVAHPQTLKADINSFFDRLVRSIEARRTALLQEAEGVCQKDLKQIWADKEFHEVDIGHITAVFGLVDRALECTNDTEMILTALQSISQLRLLQQREWDGSAFTRVVLSTPKFNRGEGLAITTVGCISHTVVKPKGLQVLTASKGAQLNSDTVFELSVDQPLVDGRSGATLILQQAKPPTLSVVVHYGGSQKKLGGARIAVTPIPKKRSYKVTVKPVCGGKHTVIFTCGTSTATYTFTVSGKPSNGAKLRKGPDWSRGTTDVGETVGTAYYQQVYHGGYYDGDYGDGVIPVRNNSRQIIQYSWGRGERYEVELA